MKTRCLLPLLLLCPGLLSAEGWNTYRGDPARSGYTSDELPRKLSLQWTYRSQVPDSAWPSSGSLPSSPLTPSVFRPYGWPTKFLNREEQPLQSLTLPTRSR